jgi:hypothetical protein
MLADSTCITELSFALEVFIYFDLLEERFFGIEKVRDIE